MKKSIMTLIMVCSLIVSVFTENILAVNFSTAPVITNKHSIGTDVKQHSYTMYIPYTSDNPATNFNSVKFHPYLIRVFYQASTSNTIYNNFLDYFVTIFNPTVKFIVMNPDGTEYSTTTIINGTGASPSGSFDIPAGKGLAVRMNNGLQRKYFLGATKEECGYNCSCQITYTWDGSSPNKPILNVKGSGTDKVKSVNGKVYTSYPDPVVSWSATDNCSTYNGYNYGPAGIQDYLVEVNGTPQTWSPDTQLSLGEGQYQIRVKARDKEDNQGSFSDPITLVVDRSIAPLTLPDNPIELIPQSDGTYNVKFTWNPVADVSGVKYRIGLSNLPNPPSDSLIVEGSNQYVFKNQTVSEIPFYAYVMAIDGVSNPTEWKWVKFVISSTPSTIDANATSNEVNGAPGYRVELKLSDVADAAQYIIERQGEPAIEPIVLTYQQLQQNGFKYVDTDNLRKHAQYAYSVYTVSALGVKSEKTSTSIVIPNIKPSGVQTIVKTGSGQSVNGQYTNTNKLAFDISPKQDSEGDILHYQLRYRNLDSSESGSFPVDNYQTTPISIGDLNLGDGQYEFWLNYRELYNDTLASEVTESLHRTIYIDSKPPVTPEVTISPSERTNQTQPVLSFAATDETSGIDHYEVAIDGKNYVTAVSPYTLPTQAAGVHTIKVKAVDKAGWSSPEATASIDIDLSAPDQPVMDKCIYLDGILQFNWHAINKDHDLAQFNIKQPDGTIQTIAPTVDPNNPDLYHGSFSVTIEGLGNNAPVAIDVNSQDYANNNSTYIKFTAYTPAKLGSLQFQGVTYDSTTNRHQIHWQLTENPGEAKNQALEYGNNTASGFTALGSLTPDAAGVFTHDALADGSKLQPHAIYHYRLVAYNNSGDPVYGEVFDQQVPNIPPTAPVLISPLRFARDEVQFQYQESIDWDGDANLTYRIYLGEGTNRDACTALPSDTTANLVNGRTYTWYVKVDDGQGGTTDSEPAQFTVDTAAPLISASEPARPYTNQTQLTITVGDDRSGIDKVSYKKTAITGEVEEGTLNPTAGPYGTQTASYELAEGSYNLQFTVWDQAGNSAQIQINNCWVDRTPPELKNLQLGLNAAGSRYLASKLQIPASFDGRDNFSGLKGLRYWLLKDRNETPGAGALIPLSNAMEHFAYSLDLPAEHGKEYYLAYTLEDRAGNRSQVQVIGPVYFDLTLPQATVGLENMSRYGAGNYLAGLENLIVNVTASDPETGIDQTKTQLAIVDSTTGQPASGWGEWDDVKQAVLTLGAKYRVAAKVTNGAGLSTEVVSEEFTYDNTAPQDLTLTGGSDTVTGGELMVFTAGASEPESAITAYRLAIVARDNPEAVLTAGIPGSDPDGWITIQTGNSSTQFRIELPEALDGVYYPNIEVINAVGLKSSVSGDYFVLNHTQEKMMVGDQGPYSLFDDHLTGWWKYRGLQSPTGYRYRIIDANDRTVYDWKTTTDTQITVSGLKLSTGMKYRFEVQASFEGGDYSASGYSPGVIIDTTGPEITKLVTPEYATTANLSLEWDGVDGESGIAKVQAALGSDYYQTDISGGWIELSGKSSRLSLDAAGHPLKLETGKHYYLTLRITNGAGSVTEMAAPGIMIDDTAPPAPMVLDQGGVINTSPLQTLDANWLWSPTDPESGLVRYQWAIIENGRDIRDATWYDGDSTKRIALTMNDFPRQHGKTYYFAVKVTNGAGLSSIGYSNGIMVDATAPFIPQVKLLSATAAGDPNAPELNYITSTQDLALWIDSLDPESQIINYQYAWGDPANVDSATRNDSSTDQIQLNNPAIAEGVLTLFVSECVNQADLTSPSGYSSGVILDTGAPKITNVRGGVSGNRFLFDWDVIPSVSPVAYYEVALVKATDVNATPANWTKVGLKRSIIVDGKDLADGRYCLLIRAWNQAGTVSRRQDGLDEWGTSPVVMLDRTAPELSDLSYPNYAANLLEFQVTAKDDLSGVGGYQYALGGKTNPTAYSGGWVDIDNGTGKLTHRVNTASIPHQAEVYLLVRAKDKVGLWSKTLTSGKIRIDHTSPVTPEVSAQAYSNTKAEISGITFTSGDPESGLTHYRLGLVAEKGGSWLATQLHPLNQFDGRLTGLNLAEGGVYYVAMQTQNGAGEWSDIGYSGPVTVDTIAPELSFAKGGTTIVINRPPLEVEYTLSEPAKMKFTLTGTNGAAKQFEQDGIAGVNYFTFNETLPQVYTLHAQAIDPAGNPGTEQTQLIRVNAPPQVILTALNGTPGKSLTYMATVTDPDGVEGDLLTYQWDPGDNTGLLTGSSPEHRYTKTGVYTLTLTVTDPDGGVTTVTATVAIGNTSGGILYADEVWSGTHHITDTITVPEGITLTILPGTEVIVDAATGGTGLNGLNIQGNLIVQGPVTFSSAVKSVNTWLGITITGQATLDGLIVEYAERGLAVIGAQSVGVTNCIFKNNHVGIHVYGAQPVIKECALLDNLWYGIKEDEGGHPLVTGCTFQGNGNDYYDETLTVISVEQLNQMAGNEGNK